ncbi:MAG: DMT family transporter [Shimia sp.]
MATAPITAPLPEAAAHRPLRSAGFMLAASALIATSTLCAKAAQVEAGLHPLQVSQGRFLFGALALVMVVALLRPRFTRPAWGTHLVRVACGWGGVTLMFAAAAMIPLSDATALSFLNPVFAMGFAIVLLGERVGPWRWAAAAIALTGALVLLRPGGGSVQLGALVALGAALVLGLEIVIIKRLSGREPPVQILVMANGIGLVIATAAALPIWEAPTRQGWLLMAGVGTAMVAAQACFVQSLKAADASFAVPFSYAVLIFATAWDAALYAAWPDATSWTGIAIIVAGAGLLAWRERVRRG